jgi:anaerobic magnesium-protoporphyrin IX monomethyl ester cyclase
MARVLLIAPPYLDLYGSLKTAAGRYFPLGIGYIASYLRKYGNHDVKMYEPEAQGLSYDDISDIVRAFVPDVIGITCSTPNFSRAISLARLCKATSAAKIVLGGVHASAIPDFIMESYADCIDCLVVGEGERTMLELVQAYANSDTIDTIAGVAQNKNGKVVLAEKRPYIDDLDSLPYPARDLIPQNLFAPNMHNARYRNCLSILTSRGCPFNCSFCAARIVSGKKYRTHSAEYVLEEMAMLKKDYNARQLLITDDTFTINHDRLEQICRGMIDRKLNLSWFCFSQVTTVNKEILELMKKAGCYSIGFGIESADESILKKMGKPIKPEKARETVTIANKVGLKTQAFYIIGSPGETEQQMKETIYFSRKVNATLSFYNMLVPYPGTKEFNHYFSSIPLKEIEWQNFVAIGEHCVLKNAAVSINKIQTLIAQANLHYYLHPIRIINLLRHIRTPYELSNYVRGGLSLLRQILRWSERPLS